MADDTYADMERAIDALRCMVAGMSPEEAEAAITALVRHWAGSEETARAWFSNAVLPGIGHTPEALVRAGRAGLLLDHIQRIGAGGYA